MPPGAFIERFRAHKTADQLNITGAIVVWQAIDEITSGLSWDSVNNRLTILKPGLYVFIVNLQLELVATNFSIRIVKNGSNMGDWADTGAVWGAGIAIHDRAVSGDQYQVNFNSSAIRDIINAAGAPPLNRWVVYQVCD